MGAMWQEDASRDLVFPCKAGSLVVGVRRQKRLCTRQSLSKKAGYSQARHTLSYRWLYVRDEHRFSSGISWLWNCGSGMSSAIGMRELVVQYKISQTQKFYPFIERIPEKMLTILGLKSAGGDGVYVS